MSDANLAPVDCQDFDSVFFLHPSKANTSAGNNILS